MDNPKSDNQPPSKPPESAKTPRNVPVNPGLIWLVLIALLAVSLVYVTGGPKKRTKLTYGAFREALEHGRVLSVTVQGMRITGKLRQLDADSKEKKAEEFSTVVPPYVLDDPGFDAELRSKLGVNYRAEEPPDNTGMLIAGYLVITLLLFAGLWFMFRRTRDQMLGGGVLSAFTRSPAKRYQASDKPVTFDDVAGLEGVKEELQEIVEFLKDPVRFQRLGAQVPKGVLLMGPPGAGKTLLGRAVAGEAGVPFFSINGSEFIQMFVGVGASRVRDLFAMAKESAPAIVFIDEIDAVGRHRGTGLGGGHDEREQTLNQILSEMDGFTQNDSVIVMAATNRPDVLDPALLRPGRFDRHVTVDRPTYRGRLAIFKVHCRGKPLADDVDLERLAAGTVGLTGADIRNLVNEAALWATRQGKNEVTMADFDYARDKVLLGNKREDVLNAQEKRIAAYHEAGHALLVWLLDGYDRIHKVSVIPRARALGVTQLLPQEDRLNVCQSELQRRLACLLAGRAAEKLCFNELSAGAEDDLKKATQLARRMVLHWGMSERLGPVAFRVDEEHPFLGKEIAAAREYSEHTAQTIDEETVRILREAADRATEVLSQHRDKLDKLATALEEEEELDEAAIERLIGPPAYRHSQPPENAEPEQDGVGTGDSSPAKGNA